MSTHPSSRDAGNGHSSTLAPGRSETTTCGSEQSAPNHGGRHDAKGAASLVRSADYRCGCGHDFADHLPSDEGCWECQCERYDGPPYTLTDMGFGA